MLFFRDVLAFLLHKSLTRLILFFSVNVFLQRSDAPSKSIGLGPNYTSESPVLLSNCTSRDPGASNMEGDSLSGSACQTQLSRLPEESNAASTSGCDTTEQFGQTSIDSRKSVDGENDVNITSSRSSPFYWLRKDSAAFVSQILDRGRKNLWHLTTSRVSVLLSCPAVCSTSIHHFLRNYEDLKVFIVAGEAFCGMEAVEFRQKLKIVCESYLATFHRQNICVRTIFLIVVLFLSYLQLFCRAKFSLGQESVQLWHYLIPFRYM